MNFSAWCAANGYDEAALSATQRKHLEAAWRSETAPAPPVAAPVAAPSTTGAPPGPPAPEAGSYDADLQASRREAHRRGEIQRITGEAMRASLGSAGRVERYHELCQLAITQNWDVQRFQLEILREERTTGVINSTHRGEDLTDEILTCAVCMTNKLPGVEEKFSDQVLQAAHNRFARGLGANELLVIAAEANEGYRGSRRDLRALTRAAFPPRAGRGGDRRPADPYQVGAVGPSTIDTPGILSAAANKFLEAGFLFSEQAWRPLAKIRPANDFKEITIYRLGGSAKFEKIGPGGEIKHGSLSEIPYGVKADIWGRLLGISEQDWRNDDLGAFAGAADELGRGAGDSMNEVFFAELLNDANFFNVDKSKGNYDDGATDSVLSLVGLDNAAAIFAMQTKPDGTPLGARPAILAVPGGLRATASNLMNSTIVVGQGAVAPVVPANNPFVGLYKVVDSVYLGYTNIGGSPTAWYLFCDPANIAVMYIVFLDGVEVPVVETGDFDFDRLGIAMRATMRWGCRKGEYRGGLKMKGAA